MLHSMVEVQDLNTHRRVFARLLPDPIRPIRHHHQPTTLTAAHLIGQRAPTPTEVGGLGKGRVIGRTLYPRLTPLVDHTDLDFTPLLVHVNEHTVHRRVQTGH